MAIEIQSMFSRIARRYDLANSLLSFGLHHRWRFKAVLQTSPEPGASVLDLACGTGDFALAFAKAVGTDGLVVGGDFSRGMLLLAAEKTAGTGIRLEMTDAMRLPHRDDSFDICSMAFGIRNVDAPLVALKEMIRVLRPGGKIVVLEFGQPTGIFRFLYRIYSRAWIPLLGGLVTRQRSAYSYLHTSSASFPCGRDFTDLLASAGAENCRFSKILAGAVFLYSAEKGAAGPIIALERERPLLA